MYDHDQDENQNGPGDAIRSARDGELRARVRRAAGRRLDDQRRREIAQEIGELEDRRRGIK